MFTTALRPRVISFTRTNSKLPNIILSRNALLCTSASLRQHEAALGKENVAIDAQKATKRLDLTFADHRNAFKGKTTAEILRAVSVLQICSVDFFVKNNLKILTFFQKYTPRFIFTMAVRPTFYDQFVASKRVLPSYVQRLGEAGIRPIIAVSMEEADGDDESSKNSLSELNFKTLMDCVQLTSDLKAEYPMMQLKVTAFVSKEFLIKMSEMVDENKITSEQIARLMENQGLQSDHPCFSRSENEELGHAVRRLYQIAQLALERNVKIMVDAEYTYINPALRHLTRGMMLVFNKTIPLVWYTYQCYLKDTKRVLTEDLEFAKSSAVCFGAKVVRGAYITSESQRALDLGTESPICATYEDTNANYDDCVATILDHVASDQERYALIIASHNENSVRNAINKMELIGIDEVESQVFFGQLMGMCDQVTYTLGKSGYKVCKSIPYGEMEEVLPYLSRRVTENTSIFQNVRKEKALLRKELGSRLLPWSK